MTLVADMAADYAYQDGLETVTFYDSSATTSVSGVHAVRGELNYRELMIGTPVGLAPGDVSWQVWASGLGAVVPAAGDTITDAAGVVWTVLSVATAGLGGTAVLYRCVARKQVA